MLGISISRRFYATKRAHECYRILQVKRDASPEDIKESFYRLSRIHHPDNAQSGNIKKFIKLREAYEFIQTAPLHPRNTAEDFRDYTSHKSLVENDARAEQWAENFIERANLRLYGIGSKSNFWATVSNKMRGKNLPSCDKSKMGPDDF